MINIAVICFFLTVVAVLARFLSKFNVLFFFEIDGFLFKRMFFELVWRAFFCVNECKLLFMRI